jgi:hypothetical protein
VGVQGYREVLYPMWFLERPTIVMEGSFFCGHTVSKSSIAPWGYITVGWRTVPHGIGRNDSGIPRSCYLYIVYL